MTEPSQRCFYGVLLCLLAVLCIWAAMPVRGYAADAQEAKEGIDAILLIDTSGSMRFSDTTKTALESARMFIDMMETRNSRIGVIAFTDTIQGTIPLTPIHSLADKQTLKNMISSFTYTGWTDIGMSLKEAVAMITADTRQANSPMILLFTDGAIQINPDQQTRTEAMSAADVDEALSVLNGKVPVYTIGLNHNGSVDIDFLRAIAGRTSARTYIAEEASALPQIFNEIFADHIRSSITEVATFLTDGETYTDVVIKISSVFVAEANIIMLSSKPLTDVRLIDPSGQEVVFDGTRYAMAKSHQYTICKMVSPAEGEWIVRAKGLPNDRVTLNLIYNYNVDIAISVTQAQTQDFLFDPSRPLTVSAGFLSANTQYSHLDLYGDAKADLRVYYTDMRLLETIPMINTGSSFTVDYLPPDASEIRLAVHVINKDFEKSSTLYSVSYNSTGPLATEEPTPTPAPTADATEKTPVPTADATEETPVPTPSPPEPDAPEKTSVLPIVGLTVAVLVTGLALVRYWVKKSASALVFNGYLEIRAMTQEGMYTALEAPSLNTYAGKISLYDFLLTSLNNNGGKILQVRIDTSDLIMRPSQQNGQPVILLENNGKCAITDEDGNALTQKRIIWRDGSRFILKNHGDSTSSRLELTYRAEDNE